MVENVPIRPLPFLILYLDQGRKDYAGKSIDFRNIQYTAKVLSFGVVERTIPYPSGLISIPDCTVEVEDTDGQIRAWFDERTPLRRIGEIAFEFQANADINENLDGPLFNPFNNEGPNDEYNYNPFFTGEIVGVDFPIGACRITLRSTTSSWMDRMIPFLGVRDNFPNMPDDVESVFIPIILGRIEHPLGTGTEAQGVIKAHHIDTTLNRYVVARHQCHEIIAVYRKKSHDARYFLVAPAEYTVNMEAKVINGINYNMTYVDFDVSQEDGTEIHVDASGINYRWDFDTETTVNGVEVRDPVDCILNLIFFVLGDEVEIQRFNADSFLETRDRTVARGYLCDGAITDQISNGLAVSKVCSDFLIDFAQTNRGEIKLHLYDAALDLGAIIPLNDSMILAKSLAPSIPSDKIKNRILYRYNRQNAGLVEFRRGTNSGNWLSEYTVDNLLDQAELAAVGANPLLELQWELGFVRDDATAKAVIKDRLGYHTLRSYVTDLDLSGPRVIDFLHLSDPVAVTEIWGIGPAHASPSAGWVDKVLRIYGIVFDLTSLECKVSAVVPMALDDINLDWSFEDVHPPHDAQVRKPHLTTKINGSVDPADPSRVYPDADQTLDFEDSLTEVVEIGISFPSADPIVTNFSPGPSATTRPPVLTSPDTSVGWVGIHWEEVVDAKPRSVKGYVPIPFYGAAVDGAFRIVSGTLDPDEKPALTLADAWKVLFHAEDFDHLYLWTGTAWQGLNYDKGKISMFMFAPEGAGWAACDGATVQASTISGGVEEIELDDLMAIEPADSRFPRFSSSYISIVDPDCNAVAPTILGGVFSAGTALSGGAHIHEISGNIGPDGTHGHDLSAQSGGAHTHALVGAVVAGAGAHVHTVAGNIGPDGTHGHNLSTDSSGDHIHSVVGTISSESAHTHNVAGNIEDTGSHEHSGVTADSAGSHTHGHSLNTDGATGSQNLSLDTPNASAASTGHTHDVVGGINSDGAHSHDVSFAGSDGTHSHDVNIDSAAGSAHTHTMGVPASADGAHAHNVIQDAGNDGAHSHDVSLSTTAGQGTHTHTLTGTVDSDGAHVHEVIQDAGNDGAHSHDVFFQTDSQGAHTHTVTGTISGITAGTQGRPKSVGLMPYFRL